MNSKDAEDEITDADALLPNGCELISYADDNGSTSGRTKCAVIVRNGGNGTGAEGVEPLLCSSSPGNSIVYMSSVGFGRRGGESLELLCH